MAERGSASAGLAIGPGARWRRSLGRVGTPASVVLLVVVLAAVAGPFLWPHDYADPDFLASSEGPSAEHPLGTDVLGRDLLARLMVGTGVSLTIAIASQLCAVLLGTALGLLAGTGRRSSDAVVMRGIDVLMAVPDILFVILLVPVLSTALGPSIAPDALVRLNDVTKGGLGLALAITATSWMLTTRLVRAEVLALRETEFFHAAVVAGCSRPRLMAVHLLPNVAPVVITAFTLGVPRAVLIESAVSYLGLGLRPPLPSIGLLIADGVKVMRAQPSALLAPALLLIVLVVAINLLGDTLRRLIGKREAERP